MKLIIIPGLPFFTIYFCQWLGTHYPLAPGCIAGFLITFAAAFTSLYLLHLLIFGHKPRFFR